MAAIRFSLYCHDGPLTDDELKDELLHQCHKEYDVFAAAMRNDAYEILTATVPYKLAYPTPNEAWQAGAIRISYDGWYSNINVAPASAYDARLYKNITEGELRAIYHLPGVGVSAILIFPVPDRIRTIIQQLQDSGERSYENTEAVVKERADVQFDMDMQAEADADPEGAFGGRGNNFDWRRY